jgi:hypothetical protein
MRQALLLLRWRSDVEEIGARKRKRLADRPRGLPQVRTEWPDLRPDGLITGADLERCLPEQIVFRGRAFRRAFIWPSEPPPGYLVTYTCDRFFDCDPPVRPWYPKVLLAQKWGTFALALTEDGHEHLSGSMFVERVPPERLPGLLQEQLRLMHEDLERHVEAELAQGCAIRPSDPA